MDHLYILYSEDATVYIEPSNLDFFYFVSFIEYPFNSVRATKKPIWKDNIIDYLHYSRFYFSNTKLFCEITERTEKNRWINEVITIKTKCKPDVYFIQSEIGGPIKIGVSKMTQERVDSFQIYYPFKLLILAKISKGGYKKEAELHRRFAEYRLHGDRTYRIHT